MKLCREHWQDFKDYGAVVGNDGEAIVFSLDSVGPVEYPEDKCVCCPDEEEENNG